jgi:peptide/nickel transport system permease protein
MATAIQTRALDEVLREPPRGGPVGWLRGTWSFCKRKPLGAIGALIIVLMVIAALFVDASLFGSDEPLLAPQHYNQQVFGDENLSPSTDHILGTDQLGRDIFSRILYGARISMIIGLGVVLFTAVVSLAIGTVSGFFTGWIDTVIQRIVDIFLAIPPLILLIYGLSVFAGRAGPYTKMFWIIIIVGVVLAAASIRVVRGAAIATANNPYVDAARTLGASNARFVFRHVMPNVFLVVIVLSSVQLGTAILAEAAISFLGLGIPPPFPSWGTMLSINGSSQFRAYPLQAVWPGLAVAIAVWGFNMFGDALRDVLDPRLRGSR